MFSLLLFYLFLLLLPGIVKTMHLSQGVLFFVPVLCKKNFATSFT